MQVHAVSVSTTLSRTLRALSRQQLLCRHSRKRPRCLSDEATLFEWVRTLLSSYTARIQRQPKAVGDGRRRRVEVVEGTGGVEVSLIDDMVGGSWALLQLLGFGPPACASVH